MHAAAFLPILAVALGVSALRVLAPNENEGWASTGSNTLSWERVSTDPTNFTVVLTNTDRSVLPENNQLLAAFVDATSATSVSIDAPSGGFNVGGSYRVNLVRSQDDLDTIYAQSDEFNITAGTSSATDSTVTSGSTATSGSASTTGSATRTSLTVSGSSSATATDAAASSSNSNPTSTANAAQSHKAQFSLLGGLLLLGGFLA
ncbi:hypothetical protein ACEPAG_6044 [Sanghuangporus baumii]